MLRVGALGALVMFLGSVSQAQEATPSAQAVRISAAVVVDGRLSEPLWETAKAVTEFHQQEPVEGELSTEPTEVRILYDDGNLYFGIRITESEPALIRASELRRDNTLEADDTFTVLLDTYHDHRNAFLFRINARGTRFDALIRNENSFLTANWDEQWTSAAVLTDTGWTAEIAIPFKILRFSADQEQTWGLNFERVIKRKNEFVYWAGWDRDYMFSNVSQAGHLTGISDIRQAERLRIRPYVLAGGERFDATDPPDHRFVREVGIDDLKYSLTPNLTADTTVNPDFAQVEADTQQINLTRFSLYFTEKRQFFIEGSDSLRMSVGFLHFGPPPLEIFYSRRIGLSDEGEPVPIVAGGKVTGKVGGFDVGVLSAQSDALSGPGTENFSVGRVRKEILGRSYIGAIVTSRQGDGRFNRVVGADARFVFFKYLNIATLAARSMESDAWSGAPALRLADARPGQAGDKRWVRQGAVEWRADKLEAGVNYIGIDPDFNPAAGFVRRHDRMFGQRLSYRPRPRIPLIRQLELTPINLAYYNDTGTLLSRNSHVTTAGAFQSGDRIELDVANVEEVLLRPFTVGRVRLPIGRYEWNESTLTLRSYNGRPVSGVAGFTVGDFYNGTKRTWNLSTELRPGKNLSLQPAYSYNNVDLAQGSFDTHLIGVRSNVSFNTNLLTSAYVQYNSAGELAAVQVRFNYIFRTIDNFIVAYNEMRYTDGLLEGLSNRSLVMKITYSMHR